MTPTKTSRVLPNLLRDTRSILDYIIFFTSFYYHDLFDIHHPGVFRVIQTNKKSRYKNAYLLIQYTKFIAEKKSTQEACFSPQSQHPSS